MRADIQRKPLGFQELTPPKYRCVAFCVVDLIELEQLLAHSLVFKTKGILEQWFSTSLLQLQTHMFIRVTVEKLWRLLTHFVAPLRACRQRMFLAITNSGC
jgi:hypothetical protein